MYPKKNARRGYAERQARRQLERQFQIPPKEGKMSKKTFLSVFSMLGFLTLVGFALFGVASLVNANAALVAPTTPASTVSITEPPVVTTKATEAPAPIATPIICETPFIDASLNSGATWESKGIFLDTELGKRMTYTSRSLLVPEKEWNEVLTDSELKKVETVWQKVAVCVPQGTMGRIFTHGFEQGVVRYENGVLMTLKPGLYKFNLRNGEIVLWYPQQDEFAAKDLVRIVEQIKVGNFDIKGKLAFFGVTADILPSIPVELVKERNVQIVPFPDVVAK